MTRSISAEGDWMRSSDLSIITNFLRTQRNGSTVLDITNGTHLSAVIVVPALDKLIVDGIVSRRMTESNGRAPTSAFTLTSSGRRQR